MFIMRCFLYGYYIFGNYFLFIEINNHNFNNKRYRKLMLDVKSHTDDG